MPSAFLSTSLHILILRSVFEPRPCGTQSPCAHVSPRTLTTGHETPRGLVPASPSHVTSSSFLHPAVQPPHFSLPWKHYWPHTTGFVHLLFPPLGGISPSSSLLGQLPLIIQPKRRLLQEAFLIPSLCWDLSFVPIVPMTLPRGPHCCFTCFLSSLRVRKCPFHPEPCPL